jgi:hypothetical protein
VDKTQTFALVVASIAFAVFAGWRGARPWEPSRGVRMMPWRFLMMLSGAATFFLLIHLATLFGKAQPPV